MQHYFLSTYTVITGDNNHDEPRQVTKYKEVLWVIREAKTELNKNSICISENFKDALSSNNFAPFTIHYS